MSHLQYNVCQTIQNLEQSLLFLPLLQIELGIKTIDSLSLNHSTNNNYQILPIALSS